jgi:hypothetical protein
MTALNKTPNIARPDDFYAALLEVHDGLSKEDSDALNARLVLILCNHIGDSDVLDQALVLAAESAN